MRITLQCSYHHAKGEAAPGDVIDVDDTEGKRLIGLGVAEAAPGKSVSQKPAKPPKTTTTGGGTTPPETGGGDGGNTGGTDDDNAGNGE